MQRLAASRQVEAGFVLLQQTGTRWQSHSDKGCYPVFRMLVHACRLVEDFDGASRLQPAVDHLDLKARLSKATVLVQGSMHCWETAGDIDDTSHALQLWFELRQKITYVSLLQALPWGFIQCGTSRGPDGTLQICREKRVVFEG